MYTTMFWHGREGNGGISVVHITDILTLGSLDWYIRLGVGGSGAMPLQSSAVPCSASKLFSFLPISLLRSFFERKVAQVVGLGP